MGVPLSQLLTNGRAEGPVSRVLFPQTGTATIHLARPAPRGRTRRRAGDDVAVGVKRPTRGRAGRPCPPIWPCSGWGLTAAASPRPAVSPYLTIAPLSHEVRRYVSVSLSVPADESDGEPWTLSSTLPGGARTFLHASAQRPPGPPTLPPQIYHAYPQARHLASYSFPLRWGKVRMGVNLPTTTQTPNLPRGGSRTAPPCWIKSRTFTLAP